VSTATLCVSCANSLGGLENALDLESTDHILDVCEFLECTYGRLK
jgi:hypothetical protein